MNLDRSSAAAGDAGVVPVLIAGRRRLLFAWKLLINGLEFAPEVFVEIAVQDRVYAGVGEPQNVADSVNHSILAR